MLDIQFIRDNRERVENDSQAKNITVDINRLLELDTEARELRMQLDELRRKRNELTEAAAGSQPSPEKIEEGKNLKQQIGVVEDKLSKVEEPLNELIASVPNVIPGDTPIGDESANAAERHWGSPREDEVKDHLTWGEERDLIDFERGSKVAGAKFYYLKGDLVRLEMAVFQLGMQLAVKNGFIPMTVPNMVNSRIAAGTGFLPRGEERQIYKIEDEDLNLIATAEMPITGYHADETIPIDKLPLCYAGLSPSYRLEAGAYGKHSKGLYRVHQFNKLELYVFCKPEDSEHWHQKLISIEEELAQMLEIPYRIVRIASGDLGAPAFKKYDVEYWSPIDKQYRELMSCSNVTDYQARRLNIRYKSDRGNKYLHTLNGTAAAFSRVCIALIENHQTSDGDVSLPESLKTLMGQDKI